MAGLTVAITAVTAAYHAWKTEQLDYKIDALTEELSVLDDAICKVNNDMQEAKDYSDNFADALETYQKLSKKGYLTSDEEDDYKDMTSLFMDSYPELVREYDSLTGTLTLWTKETEKQAEQLEEEARQAQILSSSLQLADVYMSATLDKYEELYEGYSSTTYDVAGESF
ncbi:MAG: hypothetical protein LUC37_02970 [Prevotella sp.]|nr:hypothetical protein [Prevotella sp.]